ncbi:hypothetical protein RSAG8_04844, partial [Rhizoctonia solani AG-8 WAC10335]
MVSSAWFWSSTRWEHIGGTRCSIIVAET